MRAKEPANWEPEDDEDEELVWERLRAQQAGAPHERAKSEVVPRTRIASDAEEQAGDPYASYAHYVQHADAAPEQGAMTAPGYYEATDELESGAEYDEEQEEGEDEEAVWERLRNRSESEARVSDVRALGSHAEWAEAEEDASEGSGEYEADAHGAEASYEEYQAHEQAYAAEYAEQQAYAQQEAMARQRLFEEQQALARRQAYEQEVAYAQQQGHALQQQPYPQQHAYAQEQPPYGAQPPYAQQQQPYAQQQPYTQQQQPYAQQQQQPYGHHPHGQQAYAQPQAYAAQPASSQAREPTWIGETIPDESFAPKRKKRGLAFALVAGTLLAAGGGVAYQMVQRAAPTVIQTASPVSAASMTAVGTEEARARDAIFGTHTAPPAEATPPPSAVPVVEPTPPPAVETPAIEPPAKSAAPKVAHATKSKASKHAKAKAGKAKKALHAAQPKAKAKAKKPPREKDQSGLGSVTKRSDDPLDGI